MQVAQQQHKQRRYSSHWTKKNITTYSKLVLILQSNLRNLSNESILLRRFQTPLFLQPGAMRASLFAIAAGLVALDLASAAPTTWVHPGVLVSPSQLAHMNATVHAGPQGNVMAAAFAKALKSKYAALDYKPLGPPSTGIIDCGSHSHPDNGCSEEDSDASAAYLQALLFYLTGTSGYASNVVSILNAYGQHLKGYTNSNAPLQSAWGLSKWARAAELARHIPGVGWSSSDADAFSSTLLHAALPLIVNGSPDNG
jgi:hypothetical protein